MSNNTLMSEIKTYAANEGFRQCASIGLTPPFPAADAIEQSEFFGSVDGNKLEDKV